MNRLIFYLLLLSVVGCAQVQPDNPDKEQPGPVTDEYLLHDSYFYDGSNKVFLTPCEDEYIIAFNVADKAEVYEYIKTEGFVELQGDMTFGTAGEERAYPWNEYILAWLKGDGDVSSIPKVIYTGILYKYRTEPEKRFYARYNASLGTRRYAQVVKVGDEIVKIVECHILNGDIVVVEIAH